MCMVTRDVFDQIMCIMMYSYITKLHTQTRTNIHIKYMD